MQNASVIITHVILLRVLITENCCDLRAFVRISFEFNEVINLNYRSKYHCKQPLRWPQPRTIPFISRQNTTWARYNMQISWSFKVCGMLGCTDPRDSLEIVWNKNNGRRNSKMIIICTSISIFFYKPTYFISYQYLIPSALFKCHVCFMVIILLMSHNAQYIDIHIYRIVEIKRLSMQLIMTNYNYSGLIQSICCEKWI